MIELLIGLLIFTVVFIGAYALWSLVLFLLFAKTVKKYFK